MIKNYTKKKTPFLLLVIFFLSFIFGDSYRNIDAQDIHFSQFDFNPLFVNAANTGNYLGDWRVAGLYRNQWRGAANPYTTASVSLDKQIFILNQKLGVGGLFLNDESGAGGLVYNKLYASVGYNASIQNNFIGFGFQAGYVFGGIKPWSGYNDLTGTFTGPNGEPVSEYKARYFDINAGFNFKRSINIFEPEAGFSILHLNKPSISFQDNKDEKESMQYIFYATVKTNLNDKFFLIPKVFYSGKNGISETIFGSEAGYNLVGIKSSVKKVFGGVYVRKGTSGLDALITQAGATIGRIDLAISYDLYMSDITQTGNMGAFEISFIYKSLSTLLNSYSIPCERY